MIQMGGLTVMNVLNPQRKSYYMKQSNVFFFLILYFIPGIILISSLSSCKQNTDSLEADNLELNAEAMESIVEDTDSLNYAAAVQTSFRNISNSLTPTVVSIHTERSIHPGRDEGSIFDFQGNPELFNRRFGEEFFRQQSDGSGVIISNQGYIITNYHVIDNADIINVHLNNDHSYEAEIIGMDERTDVALLKINAPNEELIAAPLGDSDSIQIGDLAIAIGNQFGLKGSVTFGIISATARRSGQIDPNAPFKDFIQTDAAINQGGSGGPLVNIYGQIIGINTSIFSTTGGSIGISFSIPINVVKKVVFDLLQKGRVVWGFIGIRFTDVPEEVSEELDLSPNIGVKVEDVIANSPALEAGIQEGDIIVAVDGTTITKNEDLLSIISSKNVGDTVELDLYRDEERLQLPVTVGDRELVLQNDQPNAPSPFDPLGLKYEDPSTKEELAMGETAGVKVEAVQPGSPAEEAGIQEGDLIISVNRNPVDNAQEIQSLIQQVEQDSQVIILQIQRDNMSMFIAVDLS